MSFLDSLKQFLALQPMSDVQTRSVEEFPDLESQLANLQRQPRPYRPASVQEALGVPAILRAVSLIAATTGSLSMEGFQRGARLDDAPRLIQRPNPLTTPQVFYRDTAYYLASRGEAWWWVAVRDTDDTPLSLYPVPPWEVTVAANSRNRLRPLIQWQGRTMRNEDMRHITYLPDTLGLRGVGPLQLCGAAASVAVESQEWAANFYAGNLPSAIGETDLDLTEDDLKEMDAQWLEKDKTNLPRWMTNGIKMKDFAIDPAKAQMTESREFQVGEAARMFGMPGPLLEYSAPGSSLTYQNNESVWREFQAGCLSPYYLEPIEQAMSDLLSRSIVARFNLEQLLRADSKTRWDIYKTMSEVLGPDVAAEIARRAEGLAPGNVDYAPVPFAVTSAIPSLLPPDIQPRTAQGVRCGRCNGLLAEYATPPYRFTCRKCKAVTEDATQYRAASQAPQVNVAVHLPAGMVQVPVNVEPTEVTVHTPPVSIAEGAVHVEAVSDERLSELGERIEARAESAFGERLAQLERPARPKRVTPTRDATGRIVSAMVEELEEAG